MKSGWRKYLIAIILVFSFFTLEPLTAQVTSPNKSTDLQLKKDEENLDVFQQWIQPVPIGNHPDIIWHGKNGAIELFY